MKYLLTLLILLSTISSVEAKEPPWRKYFHINIHGQIYVIHPNGSFWYWICRKKACGFRSES